jgi:hypothetical protein
VTWPAAWRGFDVDDLTDAMETARTYFALPDGPAKQAAGADLIEVVGSPQIGDWMQVMGNLATGRAVERPRKEKRDLGRHLGGHRGNTEIIDDAIESVQDAIAQEPGAAATGVQEPVPAGPAGPPAAVPGKPGAKPGGKKKLKRPKRGAQAAPPAAVEGPVRPAEKRGKKLRRPSDKAKAAGEQPAQAPAAVKVLEPLKPRQRRQPN